MDCLAIGAGLAEVQKREARANGAEWPAAHPSSGSPSATDSAWSAALMKAVDDVRAMLVAPGRLHSYALRPTAGKYRPERPHGAWERASAPPPGLRHSNRELRVSPDTRRGVRALPRKLYILVSQGLNLR